MAKNILVLALVILLVLLAVPILVPGMSGCSDCGIGIMIGMGLCAILAGITLFVIAFTAERLRLAAFASSGLLHTRRRHRPPRTV